MMAVGKAERQAHWQALPFDQKWVTVLLDIDEVLCVAQPSAAAKLHEEFQGGKKLHPQLMAGLFSLEAKEVLAEVHQKMQGKIRYAISSSWRRDFSREQIEHVMRLAGLDFVAENLHPGDAWCCPQKVESRDRELAVVGWLDGFHCGEPFAVIDDEHSGGRLNFHRGHQPDHDLYRRVLLCEPGVGLSFVHVPDILNALSRPSSR